MARKIFGKIIVEGGKPPGAKLRVVAWDADVDEDDHMGTALVADDGSYSIEYAGGDWDWAPLHPITTWRPDIYVVVEWLDPSSAMWRCVGKSRVYSNQRIREDREIDLAVTLPHTNACTAYGWVINKQGKPLQGYTVTAWDEDPGAVRRAETAPDGPPPIPGELGKAGFLGSAVTDGDGGYRIQYAVNPWEAAPRWIVRGGLGAWWRPDIFIRVHKRLGSGVLYRSPTYQDILHLTGVRIDAKIDGS